MLSVEVPPPHGTTADHDGAAPVQVAPCDANAAGPPSGPTSSSSTPPAPRKSATPLRLVELKHYQHKRHLQERRRLASNRLRALRARQPLLADQDADASRGPATLSGPAATGLTSHDSDRALVLRGRLQLTAPAPVLSAAHRAFHDEGTAAALVAALQREGALLFPLVTLTPAMTVAIIKALWHNLRLMSPWALEQAHRLVLRGTASAQAEEPSETADQDISESGDGHGDHDAGNDEEADASPAAHRSAFSFTATSAPAPRRSSPLDSLAMQSLTPANCIRQTHCIDLLGVKAYAHPPARNAALHGKFTLPQAAPLITSLLTKTAQLADLRVDIGLFANSAALATTLDQLPVLSHLTLRDVAPGTSTFVNGKLIYSIFGHQYLRSLDLIHVQLMHSAAMHSHLQPRNATHPISRAPLRRLRLVADRFPMVCAPGQPDTAQALALLLALLPHLHVLDLAAPNFPTPLLSAIYTAPSLTTLNLEFGCRVEWPSSWVPPAAPTGLQGTRAALMSAAALVARVTRGATPTAESPRTTPSPLTKVAIQSGSGVPAPLWAYLGHFPNLVDVSVHSFNDDQIRAMHMGKIGAKLQRLELVGVDLVPPFAVTALAPHLSTLHLTEYIFVYHAMALAAGAARTGTQLENLTLGAVVLPTKLVPPALRPVVPEGKDEPLWHDMPLPVWLAAWLIRFQPRLTALSIEVVNDMKSLADLAWLIKRSRVRNLTLTVRACTAKAQRCAARDGSELARTCHCALRPDQIRGLFNAVLMPMSPVPPSPRRACAVAGNAIRVRIPTFQACHHTIKRTARAAGALRSAAAAWTAGPPVLSPTAPHMVPLPASPARRLLLVTPPRAILRPTAAKRGAAAAATTTPMATQQAPPASPLSTPRKRMRSVDEDMDDPLEAPRKRIQRALDRARAAEPLTTAAVVAALEPEVPAPPAVRQRRNVSWSKTREVHEVSKWIGDLLY
ncbi:hypothetical protein GGF32_002062 [Allomyces javanicus]|nr:hypothetical protein GGF32_002062 [Allomyces javanicus]